MAEGGVDPLTCVICLESYKNPKFLTCYHSFCSSCLESYINKNCCDKRFKCPLCRETCVVPTNGVEGFRDNFYITALDKMSLGANALCDFCDGQAKSKCLDCDQTYCADCVVNIHMKVKRGTNHILKDMRKPGVHYCVKHPKVILTCKECTKGPTKGITNAITNASTSLLTAELLKDMKLPSEERVYSEVPVKDEKLWVSLRDEPEIHLIDTDGNILQSVAVEGNTACAAADKDGNAIVSTFDEDCLVQVTRSGITKTLVSDIDTPRGVACRKSEDGGEEIIFVTRDPEGEVLAKKRQTRGTSTVLSLPGAFFLAADPNSDLLCASDTDEKEIVLFQRNGKIVARYRKGFKGMKPGGVCFDFHGCILFADRQNKQIIRVNRKGQLMQILVKDLHDRPSSVNIDDHKQLWIGFAKGNIKVYKLT